VGASAASIQVAIKPLHLAQSSSAWLTGEADAVSTLGVIKAQNMVNRLVASHMVEANAASIQVAIKTLQLAQSSSAWLTGEADAVSTWV
jgi:NADPH-dependent ferric siderophore reductase